jgi:hypothetical protein
VVPIEFHQLSAAIPIGFSFSFYGADYSELFVSTNGFVSFVPGFGDGCCGSSIPSTFPPDGLVAGLWGICPDLGEVTRQTIGTAPIARW